ncbi:hypothetical protein ACGF7U_31405 [Micromonospora sp. NPDC047670]|uniref:hypothetical protein n=1 Tax=Micromonospora sp. NPDC047670 TaxID=3364252 RepID=UPI00371B5AA7
MARQKPPAAEAAAVDEVPQGPVATEPGCTHPDCVLEHPHAGPAVLTTQASPADGVDEPAGDVDEHDQAQRRVVDAQAALDAARAAAAAQLPGAGYVIATEALYLAGGARAHLPGDRVPVGNVARNGWEHGVRPPGDGE